MKVTKTSDESDKLTDIRVRNFEVVIEDPKEGSIVASASITYARYPDLDENVFNTADISLDGGGDIEVYDAVVAEITKQLLAEGFTKIKGRITR